ncbi:MAG: hypothetical protein FWC41_08440, partial [Firmicutes bacterium]|nr:hypothetical protein [Bacillota bacterium]
MRKIILSISSLIIITALFFAACNKEDNCNSCSKPADAIEQVSFNLLAESFSADFKIWKLDINGNYRESFAGKTDENLFQLIKKYCISKNITLDNQLLTVILYYDLPLSESLIVNDEYIKGISLYEVKGNRITHRLYVRNEDDNFHEEENVKVAVPAVTYNHINFYLENYVFADSQHKSDIVIEGDFAAEISKNLWKYDSAPIQFEVVSKRSGGSSGPNCGGPCIIYVKNTTCVCTGGGFYRCKSCAIGAVELAVADDADLAVRGCQAHIDKPLMYSFR